MSHISFDVIMKENLLLKSQLNYLKNFLKSSLTCNYFLDDVQSGETINCQKEDILNIVLGFVKPMANCFEFGTELLPQVLNDSITNIVIESNREKAKQLAKNNPNKVIINMDGLSFLKNTLSKSIDTIFLIDVIDKMEKAAGLQMIAESKRVARSQVIISASLSFEDQKPLNQNLIDSTLKILDTSKNISQWSPADFKNSISVVCSEYSITNNQTQGLFYSVINCLEDIRPKLILISEINDDIEMSHIDIVIADIRFTEYDLENLILARRNIIFMPFDLLATSIMEPIEIIRNTLINFRYLEAYFNLFNEYKAYGKSAELSVQYLIQNSQKKI